MVHPCAAYVVAAALLYVVGAFAGLALVVFRALLHLEFAPTLVSLVKADANLSVLACVGA